MTTMMLNMARDMARSGQEVVYVNVEAIEEDRHMSCEKCNDTGVIETGNNDLPCDCPKGDTARFNVAGVKGTITGKEDKLHFQNGSPLPIGFGSMRPILAKNLPGRHSCKHCGCQTKDPFGMGKTIHDVAACGSGKKAAKNR